eukprot:m51a1_g6932 putative glycogen phosphorylase 1 (914) ;mRNA; r:192920-196656
MSADKGSHESDTTIPPLSPRSLARFQRRGLSSPPTIEKSPLMHPSMNDIDEAVGDLTSLEEGDREEVEDYERLNAESGVVATRYLWDLTALYLPKTSKAICRQIASHIEFSLARSKWNMDYYSLFMATALSLRDRMIEYWNDTQEHFTDKRVKRTYYLSIEYLMGRSLRNTVSNLDLFTNYTHALQKFGTRLEELYGQEQDAGLGNGGLGRLAACFLDSLATLNYPAWGYGIRYQYGMFKQVIVHGQQTEAPEYWLKAGNPWEICRRDITPDVRFGGYVVQTRGPDGKIRYRWEGGHIVKALAYDTPVPGYRTMNTLNLRLWSALPATEFDLDNFNREDAHPDYWESVNQRQKDENISKVLYPKSNTYKGLELRFKQQYFFCCATLQDIIRRFRRTQCDLHLLHEHAAIQLNDTHPTIAIAELMRILVDVEHFKWDEAWTVVTKTFGYTNHTILPEALETWPVPLVQSLLPRHLQIIFDINFYFCEMLKAKGTFTQEQISHMSIVEEGSPKRIRMANLAIVGSHHVNGVAAIHTEILKASTFADFYSLWPEKFVNITNGVTPRRWLRQCNSALARVITKRLHSEDWVANLDLLAELRRDPTEELLQEVHDAKQKNKERLCKMITQVYDGTLNLDPNALFDVQIKRIHEYKRQLLNILGVVHRYLTIKKMTAAEKKNVVKKVVLFAGKAAPGYEMAKLIIKLINCVAEVVNADKSLGGLLKVVFVPNYNVSFAETIIPASDISQHISTAGTEASGTSNMKFAMNGGLIVGTLDGANVEILQEVGKENIFIFGATTEEIAEYRANAAPRPIDERLFDVLTAIQEGKFGYPDQFTPLVDPLTRGTDYYALSYDFASYIDCLDEVDRVWKDQHEWRMRCVRSISGTGMFSSDRTIREYAEKIWNIKPCKYVPTQSNA